MSAADEPGRTATEIGRTMPSTPGAHAASGPLPVAGKRLAHFRLERPLGRGGMGEVWLATDLALDRPVAVKLLGRDVADAPNLRERFYREARAQARIHHPHVGHIYYIGEEDGQLFFAMEYIEGESLQDRLARGPLPAAEALELASQAASGLCEAHRMGFSHRDIKPSNLMVDRHGDVKIVDFGIVKPQREGDVQLTGDHTAVMGTPLYMAPEQARTSDVDHRSDIYSLGATLHHLIAGEPPFAGQTSLQLISKHVADPRPRLPPRKGQPIGLDALLDKMMAKEPAARFQTYDELIAAIDQVSPTANRPAGFFVRLFAAGLDFLLITLVSLLVALALRSVWPDQLSNDVVIWTLGILYAVFVTARFGRTAGKAMLELEVVPEDGLGRPSLRQAAVRFLVQGGPFMIGIALLELSDFVSRLARVGMVVGGIALLATPFLFAAWAGLRADKRAPWDRAAGTRVRYRRRVGARA